MDNLLIGREKIKHSIIKLINDNKNQQLYIEIIGENGNGKTFFLNYLCEYFKNSPNNNIYISSIDYRDIYSQTGYGIIYKFIKNIHQSNLKFANYQFTEDKLLSIITTIYNSYPINQNAISLLNDVFNNLKDIKFIFFEDSFNSISLTFESLPFIFQIGAIIPNCSVVITSDKNSQNSLNNQMIKENLKNNNWRFLPPFSLNFFTEHEIIEFFNSKENLGFDYLRYAPTLKWISKGNPLLITLSYEWLRAGNNLDEYLDFYKTYNFGEKPEEAHELFIYSILSPYRSLHTKYEWVILLLSLFNNRFDIDLINSLMKFSKEEMIEIQNKIETFSFITTSKIKENELMPEELVNLLNKYVWNQIDSNNSIRANFVNMALNKYYFQKIQMNIDEIEIIKLKEIETFIKFWDQFLSTIDLFSEAVFLYHKYIKPCLEYSDKLVLINDKHLNSLRNKLTDVFSKSSRLMVNSNVIEEVINTSILMKLHNLL